MAKRLAGSSFCASLCSFNLSIEIRCLEMQKGKVLSCKGTNDLPLRDQDAEVVPNVKPGPNLVRPAQIYVIKLQELSFLAQFHQVTWDTSFLEFGWLGSSSCLKRFARLYTQEALLLYRCQCFRIQTFFGSFCCSDIVLSSGAIEF